MKNSILALVVLIVSAFGVYYFIQSNSGPVDAPTVSDIDVAAVDDVPVPVEPDEGIGDGADPLPEVNEWETVIGNSIKGTPITAYHYGTGEKEVLFVGGIHGGYSWNTALVAYELMDHLAESPDVIPDEVRVTVIPVLNPDGLERVTGKTGRFVANDISGDTVPGRFNSNDVDLNRNFDCQWQAEGTWRNETVSGGDEPFSEPESNAFRKFVRELEPDAVVAYYSAAGGVYASNCNNGVSDATKALMNTYADASEYQAYDEFDFYEVTGDMVNWLASEDIAGVSVLLTDRTNTEWSKNKAGVEAVLNSLAE